MAFQSFILTQTPTMITDRTKAAFTQEIVGSGTRFAESSVSPDTSTTPYCTILRNDLHVAKGFRLWAWTPTEATIKLNVITSEYY